MQETIARLLAVLHRKNRCYVNRSLKPYKITSSEVGILLSLYEKEGRTQEELSSYLVIDKAAITRGLKSLEHKGYIIRVVDDIDRRYNRIHLTEDALFVKDEILFITRSWSNNIEEIVGKEEFKHLYETLQTIKNTLLEEKNL